MKKIVVLVLALAALSGGAAFAQMHMPVMPHHMGGSPMNGGIIGNKHTHVYHLPGDPGQLPAPQNRVYFRTQAEAMAAGYRHAGGPAHSTPMMRHPIMGHTTPMAHTAPPVKHGLLHLHNPFAKKSPPAGTAHQ